MYEYQIKQFDELPSTNEELKTLAKSGLVEPGTVFIAKRQTKGHGQFDRTFESPLGGLYMSVYIKKELPFDTTGLTERIGVIVKNLIKDLYNLEPTIKQPNDILYIGKKLCGILVESFSINGFLHIIIGLGINLNTNVEDFSDEIKDQADSISHILGKDVDLEHFAQSILNKLNEV